MHLRNGVQGFQGLPSGLARQRAERGARVRWRLFLMRVREGLQNRYTILVEFRFVNFFLSDIFGTDVSVQIEYGLAYSGRKVKIWVGAPFFRCLLGFVAAIGSVVMGQGLYRMCIRLYPCQIWAV